MDWLDLLAVQGTLKSLLQHHSSKASVLWHSAFFIVQFSHPYVTTGKTIALTMDLCWQSNVSTFLNPQNLQDAPCCSQVWLQGHATCVVTQGSLLTRASHLVLLFAINVLKFLIIFKQGSPHFRFVLGPHGPSLIFKS